ncbi:MAG: hypothetical protein KDB66_00245 [Solirubrobacterales bacterium]|nr:hypothetical protein [Solirubrobacterales bacterium]MCB8914552.1 hypothetical protein [Thermoleophilales bacterium]
MTMNGSTRRSGLMGLAIVALLAGVVFMAGCGGSDSSSDASADQTAGGPGGGPGGMFGSLTDDQKQCLEDAGVTVPDLSDGAPQDGQMPQGQPPEGMTPPDGAPPSGATGGAGATGDGPPQGVPEGMEDLQSAMEDCDIEIQVPEGGQPPSGAPPTQGTQSESTTS